MSKDIFGVAGETATALKEYAGDRLDYTKLDASERTAKLGTIIIMSIIWTVIGTIALAFILAALAVFLAEEVVNSYYWAYLIVAGVGLLLGLILYALRTILFTEPIMRKMLHSLYPIPKTPNSIDNDETTGLSED